MSNFILNTEEILRTVNDEGLCKIENFLDQDWLGGLKEEMLRHFSSMNSGEQWAYPGDKDKSYPFGKICRIPNSHIKRFVEIYSVFRKKCFVDLTDQYFQCPNQKMLQVFFSHEYIIPDEAEGSTRNSILHFDPYEALKFMIYITDCDENSGAFRYIKGSHVDGEKTRKSHSLHALLHDDKQQLSHNPELANKYSEADVTYASAPAGSLLVFTTDIIHGGGIIKEKGMERMAVVCHNRRR